MDSRPSKRQKRPIVLSSDDEPSQAELQVPNGKSSKSGSKSKSIKNDTAHGLPTKLRPNTRSTAVKSQKPTSAQASPTSSTKKPTSKRCQPQKIDSTRSLYAFFNSTDHAQPSKDELRQQRVFSGEEEGQEEEEEDLIEDDSYDEGFKKLPTRQAPAKSVLDRRKRQYAPVQGRARSASVEKIPSASQKFKMPQEDPLQNNLNNAPVASKWIDLRPWTERYGPRGLDELMVHKRKVADVQTWLENFELGKDQKVLPSRDIKLLKMLMKQKILLILKGPSGAGKTATVAALAEAMNLDISEWRNPTDTKFASEGYFSMSSQFEDFLGRSGKFGSLTLTRSNSSQNIVPPVLESQIEHKKKLILIEEFPNTFTSTSTVSRAFRSSVLNYLAANTPTGPCLSRQQGVSINASPVIMIITETHLAQPNSSDDNLSAHRLLGPDILNHPGVTSIEFNPIAPTLLMKALDLVIQKEARQTGRRRIPGVSLLKKLSEVGDVRSAIASLEFLCLKGESGDDWGGTVASRSKAGLKSSSTLTKMEEKSLEMVKQREASLGIFHAVGKVVYNKREEMNVESLTQPPDHLSQFARPKVSEVSVEALMNETGADTQIFVAALHENYVLSCEGATFIDSINGCIDALSDGDLLCSGRGGRLNSNGLGAGFNRATYQGAALDSLRQDEICFHVAVRGLLLALPYPVKRHAPNAGVAGRKGGKGDVFKMFYPTSLRVPKQMEEIESLVDRWARQCGAGVTHSEPAYGREIDASFVPPSDVATWNRHSIVPGSLVSGCTQNAALPNQTSINMTKIELILETLPYVAKIERCNPTHTHGLDELERITQPRGMRVANDQAWDNDLDSSMSAMNSTIESQHRDVDRGKKNLASRGLTAEIGVGKLYLSDDEIEDD
ncbi:Cell cycle checkpoint protein rad17 [Pseudocyphellaria aurata]|nr:Cell cycle checkpoint protein rad17 [Pseudocyphellaria aurata]